MDLLQLTPPVRAPLLCSGTWQGQVAMESNQHRTRRSVLRVRVCVMEAVKRQEGRELRMTVWEIILGEGREERLGKERK